MCEECESIRRRRIKLADFEKGTRRRKWPGGETNSGNSWNTSAGAGGNWQSAEALTAVDMTGRDRTQEFLSAVQSIQNRQVSCG